MSGREKLRILLISLVVALRVSAAPIMDNGNKSDIAPDGFSSSGLFVSFASEIPSSNLSAIGAEILKPLAADLADSEHLNTKTLPPIPTALFMVLTGFFCVTLVKDRRIWLAGLAGVLWIGQAGIQVIPRLAVDISKRHIQRNSPANVACYMFENDDRLRSDIEGSQYIGLLYHLAGIPDSINPLPQLISPLLLREKQRNSSVSVTLDERTKSNSSAPQFAIAAISLLLNNAVVYVVSGIEQYICFSPAFTFSQLPRGPPGSDL